MPFISFISFRARCLLSLAVAAALAAIACADPPSKEMEQAQAAIDRAKATGADRYAHDELTAQLVNTTSCCVARVIAT